MMRTFTAPTEVHTRALAAALAHVAFPGMVIALWGDLGAGKTAFVRGLAEGLQVQGRVRSPSFALLHEHPGTLPLYHFDLYRLQGLPSDDGFDEYFYGRGVSAVEWPQMAGDDLPAARLDVYICGAGEGCRTLRMDTADARHAQALERMEA